jgi:hypothetical protein
LVRSISAKSCGTFIWKLEKRPASSGACAIEDRAGLGYEALNEATKAFLARAAQAPELAGLFSSFQM